MKSMTGYGSGEYRSDEFTLAAEVKSYNNRYLELVHSIPYYLSPYEGMIDGMVKEVASRGHIEVSVRVTRLKSDVEIHIDPVALSAYKDAFRKLSEEAGIKYGPTLSDFLSQEGILVPEKSEDVSVYEEPLKAAFSAALAQLKDAKEREGKATKADMVRQFGTLKEGLAVVEKNAAALEEWCRKLVTEKFEELLSSKGYDESRILQEVAAMLVKYTVNEEIVRLKAHFAEAGKLLEEEGPVGKRLDFLCQEINREVNTIGSKSQLVEVNHAVVSMKDAIENIREQLRNVE